MGGLGEQSVAALRKALRDREPQVIKIAGYALADLGPAAAPALPDLIPMIGHEIGSIRHAAAKAIEGIGPAAAPATEALIRQFEHKGGKGGYYIPVALGAIGPAAHAAIPALEKST